MHDFTDFPSGKFYDIWTQQRQSVSPCKLSEQNFTNFTKNGRFSEKRKNCSQSFQVLRLQAVIIPQWLQMPKIHYQMTPYGMSSFYVYR